MRERMLLQILGIQTLMDNKIDNKNIMNNFMSIISII